jgi:hypothetical protein
MFKIYRSIVGLVVIDAEFSKEGLIPCNCDREGAKTTYARIDYLTRLNW